MKHYPVQFISKDCFKLKGVLFYPVNTDINFSAYFFIVFLQGKGDDISIIIVLKKLLIYVQKIFVRAKDIIQLSRFLYFFFYLRSDKSLEKSFARQAKLYISSIEFDC